MKMNSELFYASIVAIKKQMELDSENANNLVEVFTGATTGHLMPRKTPAIEGLIFLLEELMDDRDEWINHFIFELDFGKKSDKLKCWDPEGNVIPLNDPYDLYNILISEKV